MITYLAVSLNEQNHAPRVGRRLALRGDDMEALVAWHLVNVIFHTRSFGPSNTGRTLNYGVSVERRPRRRVARLLHSVRRSPAVSWLPSFSQNRLIGSRAMFLRLVRYHRKP